MALGLGSIRGLMGTKEIRNRKILSLSAGWGNIKQTEPLRNKIMLMPTVIGLIFLYLRNDFRTK